MDKKCAGLGRSAVLLTVLIVFVLRAQHLAEILTSRGFPAECISGQSLKTLRLWKLRGYSTKEQHLDLPRCSALKYYLITTLINFPVFKSV